MDRQTPSNPKTTVFQVRFQVPSHSDLMSHSDKWKKRARTTRTIKKSVSVRVASQRSTVIHIPISKFAAWQAGWLAGWLSGWLSGWLATDVWLLAAGWLAAERLLVG